MENVSTPSQPKRPDGQQLAVSSHRALADATFLNQITRHNRLAYLPFTLHEVDAWAVLYLAAGLAENQAQHAHSGDQQRFEILSHLVSTLTTAESWSRTHCVPVVTCPADERVRHLFEARGLSDCLFISVGQFLEWMERAFIRNVGEPRSATLRVFPEGSEPTVGVAEDRRPAIGRGTEPTGNLGIVAGPGSSDLTTGFNEAIPRPGAVPLELCNIEDSRRQLRLMLQASHERLSDRERKIAWLESELRAIHQARAWRLVSSLSRLRRRMIPNGTRRERLLAGLRVVVKRCLARGPLVTAVPSRSKGPRRQVATTPPASPDGLLGGHGLTFPAVEAPSDPVQYSDPVDVVVWVERGYEEARACLESVVRWTRPPYRLMLVHDGRESAVLRQLEDFAAGQGAELLVDPGATSPVAAMGLVIPRATGEFLAFLRCTAQVTDDWLNRLAAAMLSDPRVGIAVPLSNCLLEGVTPELAGTADDAEPPGISEVGARIAADSGRLYPPCSDFDDDCLMVRRSALEDGSAWRNDERLGETLLRSAATQGWKAVVADDAYVHVDTTAGSGDSQAAARRRDVPHPAMVPVTGGDRILDGIRARFRHLHLRHATRAKGLRRWEGKRVLILLPVTFPGGGANVVFQEAVAMRAMGVDVSVLNLETNRGVFEVSYPDVDIPAVFAETPANISPIAREFDAVIATAFTSVEWMRPLRNLDRPPRLGYYVQDFEPYFVTNAPLVFWQAWSSYLAFPELIRFTKTEWNRDEVKFRTGMDCVLVGPSVDVDLFRPRPRLLPERSDLVRIAAMVRPSTPHRQPRRTMEVLRAVQRAHGDRVEILIFGCRTDELGDLPLDFAFQNAGVLNPRQTALLLNEADLFLDLSSHQAMGLTAMEAMCCGATVVVPSRGGSSSFVRQEENGLIVDSTNFAECVAAVSTLVNQPSLRRSLQARALQHIGQFFPERAAFRVLEALFPHRAEV